MDHVVGILAYGSLITDPGAELAGVIVEKRDAVTTPFGVEFARSSKGRDGAPTLVPVGIGGARVQAVALLLGGVSVEAASDMLYRREIGKVGAASVRYRPNPNRPDQVHVEVISDFGGAKRLLYTRIAANLENPTASELAALAIRSARLPAGAERRDGITYLRDAVAAGIETPLTGEYVSEILRETGAADLDEAWSLARGGETPEEARV